MKSSGERNNQRFMNKKKANHYSKKKTVTRFSGLALLIITLAAFTAAAVLFSNKTSNVQAALQKETESRISDAAAMQIQALLDEKESRTPTERMIDSQLLYALKQNRKQAIANGVETLETRVVVDKKGMTTIDIVANDLKGARIKLEDMGGIDVISAVGNGIRARVNIEKIDSIAALPEVRFVSPRLRSFTTSPPALNYSLPQRSAE